jgi:hypothetical protein
MASEPITNAVKLAELKRERAMRHRVYPRFIDAGKMTRAEADCALAVLNAIILDYENLAEGERRQNDLFG